MTIINDKKFNWVEHKEKNTSLFYKGSEMTAHGVFSLLKKETEYSISDQLNNFLKNNNDFSSGILETPEYIIAWVDHIRSWPIFYYQKEQEFCISQNAYKIKDKISNATYDENALIEFKLSGYVTGIETLIQDLHSLNPGEFCIWNKEEKTLLKHKYFSYIPTFDSDISQENAIKKLSLIFDKLTQKVIDNAKGRKIVVPLSGGLDSRILLCKLHEFGYKNIETFTYGPRFNFEGLIAKKIAKKLNVPWKFIHIPSKVLNTYFHDEKRKDFWKFSGNLKTIPCMREYSAIRYLHENNKIDKDAIFLNGQSGDYITGGHISALCREKSNYSQDDFHHVIIDKHYDLWKQYKTDENISYIKQRINALLHSITGSVPPIKNNIDGAIAEETWEYEGRQICYVVNGQRTYDYFGYDWEMPLWEKELVDFYLPLPLHMKEDQKLYKDYLKEYNYKNLFPEREPYIWRWPVPMLWVVPVAQIIGFLRGRKAKDNFYAKMRYWGHYANQYSFFGWETHTETFKDARSIISLYVPEWLKNHKLPF